mgnify:CR=1 FL=1
MGAVTRALANNIGANGVLVAGAFNNTKSFGNITSLPASIASGQLKLLSTTTISTDTTNVDITANIDSTYPIYQFRFINLKVETDGANLQIDFSHNGGSSFGASKTPHIYIVSKLTMKVEYIGALDNSSRNPDGVTEKYVENALDALLTGKKIEKTTTVAIGCSIKV